MDTEQQIRLNFLDEAEEYFNQMESSLLGLADTEVNSQKVDNVLRSAHSIKGGAGMMSFTTLSQAAHRLEDFLKILRVRYSGCSIEVEVETLLLQSVDSLRNLANLSRFTISQTDPEIETKIGETVERLQPVFEQLRSHLGDLEAADENALMAQDEDFDPALLIFEEGVDEILNRFEEQFSNLSLAELTQELSSTAEELMGFGNIASLDPFIQLCVSIQQEAASISETEIDKLAKEALKTWRRSHALVLLGSVAQLPSALEGYESSSQDILEANIFSETEQFLNDSFVDEFEPAEVDLFELNDLESAFKLEITEPASIDESAEIDSLELNDLQSAFESEIPETASIDESTEVDSLELNDLQSAFELEIPETASIDESAEDDSLDLSSLKSAFEDIPFEEEEQIAATPPQIEVEQQIPFNGANPVPAIELDKMVRVPASQLKQFNTLFEQLVLNRNSIGLRLEQLQGVISLMSQRMFQMERSNTQLKQWYDRASVEGLLSEKEQLVTTGVSLHLGANQHPGFDSLEMDRYSDIHLICQEQIETIVQLQEVATDIELGIQQVHQSVRDLHYTTRSMQGNVTRTQMLPFADAVKRFPRVIRDLNLQFNKKVELKIVGERSLLDRSVIETLADPLMHLLRNSFDHGIEDSATRIAAGKPESGTITIQAKTQGTYSVITLSDDGGGISIERIRDRVAQMGFSPSEIARISEAELLNFIFEPGFSTAQKVTELSGRGVGMDVVRTNLQEIRGDVQVDTKPGKGTTFTLRIPFTLSILPVAIVEQGGIIFAIPANSVRELIPSDPQLLLNPNNLNNVDWQKQEIPLIEIEKLLVYNRLYNTVSLTGNPTINQTMTLIVGDDNSFAALKINRFWDKQESTIRAIDSPIPLPPGVISSVVFGDGKVIPLIDPIALWENKAQDSLASGQADSGSKTTSHLPLTQTILVVDDSINVRRYLSLTLEKAGYRVEQAKDGLEAMDRLVGGLAVQAVISDVEMPRLDGYGFLVAIKGKREFANLPVAMLTSRSNEKHRKLAMDLGASAYFSKPYNEQELLEQLTVMLGG